LGAVPEAISEVASVAAEVRNRKFILIGTGKMPVPQELEQASMG